MARSRLAAARESGRCDLARGAAGGRAAASDRARRAMALRSLRRQRRAGHRGSVALESVRAPAARLLRELVADVRRGEAARLAGAEVAYQLTSSSAEECESTDRSVCATLLRGHDARLEVHDKPCGTSAKSADRNDQSAISFSIRHCRDGESPSGQAAAFGAAI